MQVIGPAPLDTYVAGSGSWDNGVYTLRVSKYRCDLTPKWLGWAWYQNY
jgi:hypothetical protein